MALVIFDLDDTLIYHVEDTFYEVFNRSLEESGLKRMNYDKYKIFSKKVWNQEDKQNSRKAIKQEFDVEIEDFIEKLYKYDLIVHEEYLKNGFIEVFDDVVESLSELKNQGHKIALVTNSSRKSAVMKIKKIGEHLFDFVLTRDDIESPKPNPEPILKTVSIMGFEKEDSIYIGDSEVDKIASERANIKFLMINRGNGYGDIKSLNQLHKLIGNEN